MLTAWAGMLPAFGGPLASRSALKGRLYFSYDIFVWYLIFPEAYYNLCNRYDWAIRLAKESRFSRAPLLA